MEVAPKAPRSNSKATNGPRNTDWYSHYMYIRGTSANRHHLKTYGPVSTFGYKDLIPLFKADKFNADEWVDLYVKAGAYATGGEGLLQGYGYWIYANRRADLPAQ